MSCLFRRICTRKTFQILLENTSKNSVHYKARLPLLTTVSYPNLQITRYKSKGGKNKTSQRVSDTESEKESNDEDILDKIKDKHTKTMDINVPSMRVDALLKAGLGLSRNRIEVIFYESKIRVNGEKIVKKSVSVAEGDEIDVIKGTAPTNPDFLVVGRVEILSAKGDEDSIRVKIRRCKSLTVENYEGRNKWSQSSQE